MLNILHRIGIPVVVTILLLLPGTHAISYLEAGGQLAAKLDGELEFYHSDSLGSTRTITNEAAEILERQRNLPFGGVLAGEERYGFTGKELDESGLQYFGARYYNSETGIFISTDPAMQYYSPYTYAANNPLAFIDPDGMQAVMPLPWGPPPPPMPFTGTSINPNGGGFTSVDFPRFDGGFTITEPLTRILIYSITKINHLIHGEGFTSAPRMDPLPGVTSAGPMPTTFMAEDISQEQRQRLGEFGLLTPIRTKVKISTGFFSSNRRTIRIVPGNEQIVTEGPFKDYIRFNNDVKLGNTLVGRFIILVDPREQRGIKGEIRIQRMITANFKKKQDQQRADKIMDAAVGTLGRSYRRKIPGWYMAAPQEGSIGTSLRLFSNQINSISCGRTGRPIYSGLTSKTRARSWWQNFFTK